MAVWNMEDGELTADYKGDNDLTNHYVSVSTSDYKQGGASGEFIRTMSSNLKILDADLDSGFPLKNGESNKTFSFTIWFKLDTIEINQWLINKTGIGKYCFVVFVDNSNRLTLYFSSNGETWNYSTSHASVLSVDTWYHAAITYDNSDYSYRIRIWDDMAKAILGTDKTGTAIDINVSDGVFSLSIQSFLALNGHMDQVVVFKDVLTVAEIDAIRSQTYSVADVLPETLALVLTQETPSPGLSVVVEPSTFTLALMQETSSVWLGTLCSPSAFELAAVSQAPALIISSIETPVSLSLALALPAPLIAIEAILITPDTLALEAALLTSTVILRRAEMPPEMHAALIDPYAGGAWLWLVEISIPGYETIRLARNTEDVVYAGVVYEKSNFDIGLAPLTGDGSVPRIMLQVAQDADHTLEDKINATQGAGNGQVKIIRTHEDFLTTAIDALEQNVRILTSESDTERLTFSLGIPDPLLRKIPLRRYSSKRCPYALPGLFKGPECGYEGEDTSCGGTYEDCLAKNNAARWGGELGLNPNVTRI